MILTSHPLLFIDFINRFNLNQTNPTQQDEGRCPRFRSRYPRGFGHAHLPRPKACGNGCRCTHHHPGPPIRFDFGEPRERLLVRTSSYVRVLVLMIMEARRLSTTTQPPTSRLPVSQLGSEADIHRSRLTSLSTSLFCPVLLETTPSLPAHTLCQLFKDVRLNNADLFLAALTPFPPLLHLPL